MVGGPLAKTYGAHYGVGIAAFFRHYGHATYRYGYRYLPARVERRSFDGTRLTPAERRIVFALIVVMIITIFQSTAFYQVFNVNSVWIQQYVALDVGGFRIPVPWFQTVNSIFSIICVPLLFWIWRNQALRGREPNEMTKIGTGAWIAAASNLILVGAIVSSGDAPVHPIGWIGGFYEKMTPAQFWAMHAAIGASGGLLVLLFGPRLTRVLHSGRSIDEPTE